MITMPETSERFATMTRERAEAIIIARDLQAHSCCANVAAFVDSFCDVMATIAITTARFVDHDLSHYGAIYNQTRGAP